MALAFLLLWKLLVTCGEDGLGQMGRRESREDEWDGGIGQNGRLALRIVQTQSGGDVAEGVEAGRIGGKRSTLYVGWAFPKIELTLGGDVTAGSDDQWGGSDLVTVRQISEMAASKSISR